MTLETATLLQLSIIIPVHNAEQYIERCVDSFIGTFNAFSELILMMVRLTIRSNDVEQLLNVILIGGSAMFIRPMAVFRVRVTMG